MSGHPLEKECPLIVRIKIFFYPLKEVEIDGIMRILAIAHASDDLLNVRDETQEVRAYRIRPM